MLQEDINYPREEGKQGIKLPLCRFLEAAISGRQPDLITIEEIKIRINNHGNKFQNLYLVIDSYYQNLKRHLI